MMRRGLRVLVLLLTVAITAGVVWRVTANEQARGRLRQAAQQTDAAAADAIFELADLRATLHAYVAPGQGVDFWAGAAERQLASLRSRIRDLEPAAAAANHPLVTVSSGLEALAGAERRARVAVQNAQPLVAGDIIFAEARDVIDASARDLSDARQALARAQSAREAGAANEQSLLAGALMAAWIFALILLVPVPSRAREEGRAAPLAPAAASPALQVSAELPRANGSDQGPAAPSAPDTHDTVPVLQDVAALCGRIGRVADASELHPVLERAAALMRARGVVVWLADRDQRHLLAVVAHGYDDRLLDRMGAVPIDGQNLTATAFRTQATCRGIPTAGTSGAVAVPLVSALGASGVLAAEVPHEADVERAIAVGEILAAQLSSLFPGTPVPS